MKAPRSVSHAVAAVGVALIALAADVDPFIRAARASDSDTWSSGNVYLEDFSWRMDHANSATWSGRDDGMRAAFAIRNDNPFPIKNFQIRCAIYDADGATLPTERRIVEETVPAHERKTFREFLVAVVPRSMARAVWEIGRFKKANS